MGKIYKFQYLFVHAGIDSKENLSDQLKKITYSQDQMIFFIKLIKLKRL